MTPIERIQKAKVAIMRHPKFCAFSGVLAFGQHTIDDATPTARTDGRNVKYSSAFVTGLSDPQLRLLVLHEGLHIAFRHMHVWRDLWGEDARLANIAADHFVNLALTHTDAGEGFVAMPSVGVQPEPRYLGWSVKQIFDDLKQSPPTGKPKPRAGNGNGGDSPDEGGGFDQHDWETAGKQTAAEQEAAAREIDQALRQGEMLARKRSADGAGSSSAIIDALLAPRKNWRELLRDFVTQTCQGRDASTWARPNRRFLAEDVYMPSMIAERMGELVVAIDTSGSCFSGSVITRFASELASIVEHVKPSRVRVLYWDTGVSNEQIFDDGQFVLASLRPTGGGGTDGSCISQYLKAKHIQPEAVVVFTDGGVGSWGEQIAPTLWAITSSHIQAPWGTTIEVAV